MRERPSQHGRDHRFGGTDPAEGPLHYVTPIAPADAPSGFIDGASFEGDWGNIADEAPSVFWIGTGGPMMRLAVTGGEGSPGSTIFTLPAGFRREHRIRLFAAVGIDGTGIGTIVANTDGTVVFVGEVGA